MKTHTESEENYIKALYYLGGDNPVSNGDLAQRIGAKGSSVTQAVKRLGQKNLVTVVPYRGVQLTEAGVYWPNLFCADTVYGKLSWWIP